MNENETNRDTTIDLLDLGKSLLSHWVVILLVTLAGGILAFLISAFLITPEYTSTTSIYVMPKTSTETQSPTYNDLTAGTQLTNDYAALAKSRPVLQKVIQDLNLQMTPDELSKHITVDIKSDTRILVIHVEDTNPHQAQKMADATREALTAQIISVMGVDNVTTVEPANFPDKPSSPNVLRNTILGAFLAFVVVVLIYTVYYVYDDTIKTPEDVEKHLGLTVLAEIPMENNGTSDSKSRRRR